VLEFYASTEGNAVLANASGEKTGSLGRPLPGATDMSVVAYDFRAEDFVRDEQGFLQRCGVDRPGMLIARVDRGHPMAGFDGYVDEASTEARVLSDVFELGDRWFQSGDLLRQDADGDYWFVDRMNDVVRTSEGPVFTREVEDTLYRRPDIEMVAVHGLDGEGEGAVVATVLPRGDDLDLERFAELVQEKLQPRERPRYVCLVDAIPMTDGYRPLKRALRERGLSGARAVFVRGDDGRYCPQDESAEPVSPRAK
jgi:putative long chain acyl-CoA synthase